MVEMAGNGDAGLAREEAGLARAAAAGDGDAFATLYERYAPRAYNLAHRLSGSEDDAADAVQEAFVNVLRRLPDLGDRELAFGSYLFTATRNATYDLMRRQQRASPSDSIPEGAVPVGAGAGGLGLDPGDPGEDPERKALLASQQEEISAANARLPERQREALALRELEELSYDEIAAVMEMNRNSVAQLISRARINLRDELRGTALASIAASSPACERALPLLAMRDDGQLEPGSADDDWLDGHLAGCETCALAREAMQEAGASYRLWVPLAIAPLLFRETAARAAALSGADWDELVSERLAAPPDPSVLPGMPTAYRAAPASRRAGRRRLVLAAAALALLLGGAAAVLAGGSGDSVPPPADEAATAAPIAETIEKTVDEHRRPGGGAEPNPEPVPAPDPADAPATPADQPSEEPLAPPAASEEPQQAPPEQPVRSGNGAVEGPQAVEQPAPDPKPQPAPPPAAPPPAAPSPAPPPPSTEQTEPTEPTRPPREPREPEEPRDPNEPPAGVRPRG